MTIRRGRTIAVLVYGVMALGWLGFAHLVAPGVIADAYQGRSLAAFNQVLARTSRRPLPYYLALWHDFAQIVLIALATHAVLFGLIRSRRFPARLRWCLVIHSGLFLGVTVFSGLRQDYPAYIEIWRHVLAGADPWWIDARRGYALNAYGPLFNALAPLAARNQLAPKLLFSGSYLLTMILLLGQVAAGERTDRGRSSWILFGLLAHPSYWIHVAWYGHLDILPAIACVGSVALLHIGRDAGAGFLLAVGTLLKYLPAALGPALACSGRRLHLRFAVVAAVTTGIGLFLAYELWGATVGRPLAFAANRPSQLLSIFRFLRGAYSPIRLFAPDLDSFALPALVLAQLVLSVIVFVRGIDPARAAVVAALTTTLLYRVGYGQYQMTGFLLIAQWYQLRIGLEPAATRPRSGLPVSFRVALGSYLAWMVGFDVFDWAIGGSIGSDQWAWLEDVVGLPTFVLGAWLVVEFLRPRPIRAPWPRAASGHPPPASPS